MRQIVRWVKMITVNYICDRCGTYFVADDLIQVDMSCIAIAAYNNTYDLCPGCATKLITKFMEKKGCDDSTNN